MPLPDLTPLVEELVSQGAEVVWLAGSHARGDHGPHSDIDVGVLQARPERRPRLFRMYRGTLTSVVWSTLDATRASFGDPAQIGAAVPGWRDCVLLHDPRGVGAELREEAQAWTWEPHAERCDRWVGAQLAQLAEEVHKLFNALTAGEALNACARRNVLALRLPLVMSVRRRILYDSEKRLWDLVAGAVGDDWREAQHAALVGSVSLVTSVDAALRMFAIAAADAATTLSRDERDVVEAARALIATR